eukprot:1931420-Pyramimonas_sp.AAC.1
MGRERQRARRRQPWPHAATGNSTQGAIRNGPAPPQARYCISRADRVGVIAAGLGHHDETSPINICIYCSTVTIHLLAMQACASFAKVTHLGGLSRCS